MLRFVSGGPQRFWRLNRFTNSIVDQRAETVRYHQRKATLIGIQPSDLNDPAGVLKLLALGNFLTISLGKSLWLMMNGEVLMCDETKSLGIECVDINVEYFQCTTSLISP